MKLIKQKVSEPKYYVSKMTGKSMLNYRVYHLSGWELALYFAAAFAVCGAVSMLFFEGIGRNANGEATTVTYICDALIFVIVGYIGGSTFIKIRAEQLRVKRQKALKKQFVDFLSSIIAAMSSGKNLVNAVLGTYDDLLIQYRETDYIMSEIKEISIGMSNGLRLSDMIADFGYRSGIKDILNFSCVFESINGIVGADQEWQMMRNTADILTNKMNIEIEIETKVASNKMEQGIMFAMPILVVAMLRSSAGFSSNFTSPLGIISTFVAIGLFVAAFFISRKILDIEV